MMGLCTLLAGVEILSLHNMDHFYIILYSLSGDSICHTPYHFYKCGGEIIWQNKAHAADKEISVSIRNTIFDSSNFTDS